ncbi:unnamed protein product, partial [Laminaria digitata]
QFPDGKRLPLHSHNVLLRGCQLRNTEWCRGVVVYTGRETKIQMNAAEPPVKYSSLKAYVDWETLRVLCLQVQNNSSGARVCTACVCSSWWRLLRWGGMHLKFQYFYKGS